jgi:hypothetical protein
LTLISNQDDDPPHCFKRIPAIDMQDKIPADLTECKNRDIVFVKPTECLKPDMDHESESENGKIIKFKHQ